MSQTEVQLIKAAAVVTADIADQAVDLSKLPHGTSSNNGKFLRANNGADPSFETVSTDLVGDTSPQLGGDLQSNGNDIDFADNDKAIFGTGGDLEISHNGTKSLIRGATATNIDIKTAADFFVTHADTDGSNGENCRVLSGTGVSETRTMQPVTDNTYDLGTSSKRYANIYTTDLQLSNEGKTNDVDGTWGNYTIQEGESDLFLINNRSGKKYKFNLMEVS